MAIDIIKSYTLRQTHNTGFPRTSPPTQIIIHGTGGAKFGWPLNITNQGEKFLANLQIGFDKKKLALGDGLFHYFIGDDGRCWEVVDPANWVYHASIGSLDQTTIGIETFNLVTNNQGSFASCQIDTLYELIKYLLDTYPTITSIAGHGAREADFHKKYKICPGPNFSWSDLQSWLTDRGYTFTLKTVTYTTERWGDTDKAISGQKTNEYIENIALTGTPSDSDSDKKTEEEVVADNTDPEAIVEQPNTNADIFADDPIIAPSGLKEVAVQGTTLKITTPSVTGALPIITSSPSTTCKAETKGIFKGTINVSASALTKGTCGGASGVGTIEPTATKTKADNSLVIRKGDSGSFSVTGIDTGTAAACSFSITVEIDDPKQTSVLAK